MPYRNVIINGALLVDQKFEGTNSIVTSNGAQDGPDRYFLSVNTSNSSTYSITRSNIGNNSTTGLSYALNVSTRSNVTLASTDSIGAIHRIESTQLPFNWGSANGLSATLSFWFRSSVTGTHSATIQNSEIKALTHSYVIPITVSSANTWQQVTATIPAPPSGSSWTNDTTLAFNLFQDSAKTASTSTWLSGNFTCPSTYATTLYSTANNYFQVTGIQLETGSTATTFEYRPYKDELKSCQRYYEKSFPEGVTPSNNTAGTALGAAITLIGTSSADMIRFETTKCRIPTITFYNPNSNTGVVSTDTISSSNLSAIQRNIGGFGVSTTDSNLQDKTIYFNWAATTESLDLESSGTYSLRSSDLTASPVSTWSRFSQSTSSLQPSWFNTGGFNNGSYVDFAGGKWMNTNSSVTLPVFTNGGCTFAITYKVNALNDGWDRILEVRHSSSFVELFVLNRYGSTNDLMVQIRNNSGGEASNRLTGGYTIGVWKKLIVRYTDSTKKVEFFSSSGSTADYSFNFTAGLLSNWVTSNKGFELANNEGGSLGNIQVQRAHFLSRPLSDAEVAALFTDLSLQ
jgi:hypothetical protein